MTPSPAKSLRVVIADDDAFTVSLVSSGLEAKGFEVTTAASVVEALEAIRTVEPNALVSDLNFGTAETGADLLASVSLEWPWIGLVVLTSHRSPGLAVAHPEKIPSSAVYLVKSQLARIDDLVGAIHQAISGHRVERDDLDNVAEDNVHIPSVTAAQAEVLRMLAEGASTRALAEARGTTVRAVETMLNRLFTALGLDTGENANPRVAAVTMWQRGGIRVR